MSKDNEYQKLLDEIEKVKFHNLSLLTLIGTINKDKMETWKRQRFYEATGMFEEKITSILQNYNSNETYFSNN